MSAITAKREPGMGFYIAVWIGLLVIVGVEVALTYQHPSAKTLLFSLLCLAFLEAAIAALYLMHLKFEDPKLFWYLIPITLFLLAIMDYLWPDAYRILSLGALK